MAIRTKYGRSSRLYKIWQAMLLRCNDPRSKSYKQYGGRGIKVCADWVASYELFHEWAKQNGHNDGLEIDRIDSKGNYEPSNCRWITRDLNQFYLRLSRKNKNEYRGVNQTASGKWYAKLRHKGKDYYSKTVATAAEAGSLYDDLARTHHGEFAALNFPAQTQGTQTCH